MSLLTREVYGANSGSHYLRMYLIKQVPKDARKLEMCFDCSAFQYQLKQNKPFEDHVFQVRNTFKGSQNIRLILPLQTIFLNKKHKDTWSIDEIKEDKISKSSSTYFVSRADPVGHSSKGLVASIGAFVE